MPEAEELLRTLSDRLQTSASVRNVFGEPVTAGGRTIIPVARVAYGLGAGAGETQGRVNRGGGGGVAAIPVGVVEITASGTRLLSFPSGLRAVAVALGIGFSLGIVIARRFRSS